jgi:hypothetical protein
MSTVIVRVSLNHRTQHEDTIARNVTAMNWVGNYIPKAKISTNVNFASLYANEQEKLKGKI